MRVALISDLHGNELALAQVLTRIRRLGADRVVCLGDVATLGARPREVLAMVADAADICILGNHDEFLLDALLIERYTEAPVIRDAVDWCRAEIGAVEREWLAGYAREQELDLGGGARLHLFHGSPRSNMEDILATTPVDAVDTALDGRRATVLAGGHTHLQMLRQHQGMLLVNPGSVGMPFREPPAGRPPVVLDHAELAMVDAERGAVSVRLERVPLDRAALRAQAVSSAHPLARALAHAYA
jgi:predicted phosphodiesterase